MSNKENVSDDYFLFVILALLGAVGVHRNADLLLRMYHAYRPWVAILLTACVLRIYFWVASKIRDSSATKLERAVLSTSEGEDALLAGKTPAGRRVYIKHVYRRMHTQIIGTTNAGKTESVIIPWAVDDMKRRRGLIIIDGKSDRSLLDKLFAYASLHGRAEDVRILSLCEPRISSTFNPLAGGSPLEVTERLFSSLTFENEYFKSLQYEATLQALLIFEKSGVVATPLRLIEFLRSPTQVKHLAVKSGNESLIEWASEFLRLKREEREQRTSGLVSQLQAFSVGEMAEIFNPEVSDIDLNVALERGQIIYCQLPVLKIPTLGKVTGKMILQSLQSAIASRHLGTSGSRNYFSVYLDDFTEYLNEGFVSLLNKSRSANVQIVFAHQALGDLAALGDEVRNSILTNANLKVFMRTNEPESAEYFSKVIGTSETEKLTERQTTGFLGTAKTGDGSVRAVEEFKIHPNVFKQDLGVGQGIVVIPHGLGSLATRVHFSKLPDIEAPVMPTIQKIAPSGLPSLHGSGRGGLRGRQLRHSESETEIESKEVA